MITLEECRKIAGAQTDNPNNIAEIESTNWGYIVYWKPGYFGLGPALVDGETGFIF